MRTKLTDSQKEKCGRNSGTLCWSCRRLDCSWMRSLQPVPGWTAEPRQVRVETFGRVKMSASYRVEKCPMFEPEGAT